MSEHYFRFKLLTYKPISTHTTRKNVDKSLFCAVTKSTLRETKEHILTPEVTYEGMAPHVTSLRDISCYEKKMSQSCSNMLEFGFCGSFAKSWHPKSLEVERYIYISISWNVDTRKTICLPVLFSLWLACQHFHSVNYVIPMQLQKYFKCEVRFYIKLCHWT